jgi:flagellar hook protein FlgE
LHSILKNFRFKIYLLNFTQEMKLESALRNSSSGLYSHGQAISVVGDNVANVNTTGFKRSRTEFGNLLAEGETGLYSGVIKGEGDGVYVDNIRALYESGIIEETGRPLDLAIEGDGFFTLGTEADPKYTRAGVFSLTPDGTVVDNTGLPLLGYPVGTENPDGIALQNLNISLAQNQAVATTTVELGGNLSSLLPISATNIELDSFNNLNANSSYTYPIEVYDSLGGRNKVTLAFNKTAINTWSVTPYVDGAVIGQEPNTPVAVGEPLTLNFSDTGQLPAEPNALLNLNIPYSNGAQAGALQVNLSNFAQTAAPSAVISSEINGVGLGNIQEIDIDELGVVNLTTSEGNIFELGRVALANFNNRDGLVREGANHFRGSELTGEVLSGLPGTASVGKIRSQALERSNVDVQEEFVNLVVYQRGYQANSQAFSTTSELLQQTIQLLG